MWGFFVLFFCYLKADCVDLVLVYGWCNFFLWFSKLIAFNLIFDFNFALFIYSFVHYGFRSGVGVEGAIQTFYYCEVTDDMKSEQGKYILKCLYISMILDQV